MAGVRVHVRPPPKRIAVAISEHLHDFFAEHDQADFRAALDLLTAHYGVTRPRIRWQRSIDRHETWGVTFDTNAMHLYHPRHWKRRPKPPTDERTWVETFWHEVYHLLTIVREEKRADAFAALAMGED